MLGTSARTHGSVRALAATALFLAAVVLGALGQSSPDEAANDPLGDLDWPRRIVVPEGEAVVYQPQLETYSGIRLTARAAVSVTPAGEQRPTFGAVWLDATVETDRDRRIVHLIELEVRDAKFPHATPAQLERLGGILEADFRHWDPVLSLDRLLTSLEHAQMKRAAEELRHSPPRIIAVEHSAVLVSIDGEPRLTPVSGTRLRRVVNTPAVILYDPQVKTYFLGRPGAWLAASTLDGPWDRAPQPPVPAAALTPAEPGTGDGAGIAGSTADPLPRIIVVTSPAELIATDGPPVYATIEPAGLQYVANTDADVFRDPDADRHYVLLSGRWFISRSLNGLFTHVAPSLLPGGFARIPPDSPKGHVRTSVPGTVEAAEAVHEVYIPQTARIDLRSAGCDVDYDGAPRWERIEGTGMAYAVNTSSAVIRENGAYYCCDDAVWHRAEDPLGPWSVSALRPEEVDAIPSSCPLFNVRFVHVYEASPDLAFVGYTPGYTGSYVYDGTVVYGTGWAYRSWTGDAYHARPATYGYGAAYRRYDGWTFAPALATGWMASGAPWGGWTGGFGPWGWCETTDGNEVMTTFCRNVYALPSNRARNLDPWWEDEVDPEGEPLRVRENNVFADLHGNVHRRTDEGWQRLQPDGWTEPKPAAAAEAGAGAGAGAVVEPEAERAEAAPPAGARRDLDRQLDARRRGQSRRSSFRYGVGRGATGASRVRRARGGPGRR